jgi:two-component system, LytTR family, sensor kinase
MKLPLKIFIHSIYWLVFSLFSLMVDLQRTIGSWPHISNLTPHFFVNLLWAAIIFYLFYFYFIRFFERRQFVRYLLYSIGSSVVLTLLLMPLHKFFNPHVSLFDYRFFLPPVAGTFIIAQCGSLVRGFENWFAGIQQKAELENRNLRNELELLRSQINPHFLFNALNNIDSLIRSNPDAASDSLVTLSDMLRYMIYETRSDQVPLDKEVVYIRNYIRLQQMRFRDKDYIRASFPENCCGIEIAPMILIPYIENAFKYARNPGKSPAIDISLQCHGDQMFFACTNYCSRERTGGDIPGGFGLENARRRLALLYPRKHELAIFDEDSVFRVELKIQLA